jgi:hypothetical protein
MKIDKMSRFLHRGYSPLRTLIKGGFRQLAALYAMFGGGIHFE